jgi:hypothetical protein
MKRSLAHQGSARMHSLVNQIFTIPLISAAWPFVIPYQTPDFAYFGGVAHVWWQATSQPMKGQDMLPLMSNAKRNLIAGVTAVAVLAAGSSPALAWGKNEQQFLAGVVTTMVVGGLILHQPRYGQPQPQYQPQYQPRPQYQPQYQPQPQQYQPQHYQPRPRYQHEQRPVRYQPAPVSCYGTPIGLAFNSYTANEKRRIQSTLTAYGYYRGGIDGAFGPGTYSAIEAYAQNTGKTAMLGSSSGAYGLLDGLLF